MESSLQMREAVGGKVAVLSGLRALLAEKYPQAPVRQGERFAVTTAAGEAVAELRQGAITEVSGSLGSGGLFMDALCHSAGVGRQMCALVDAAGALDMAGAPAVGSVSGMGGMGGAGGVGAGRMSERFLWVWCQGVQQAVRATDLLLRDGNLPLVILDVQMSGVGELRCIPATTWYRFQRIMEQSSSVFVVLTAKPMISSATERLVLHNRWTLRAMRQPRAALRLQVECVHRGSGHGAERQDAACGNRGGGGERQIA